MEPRNIDIDYKELCEKAIIKNEQMAEKIEMQEELIAQPEVQIKNQEDIIRVLEAKLKSVRDCFEAQTHEIEILKAQMDVVRMIFGGRNE